MLSCEDLIHELNDLLDEKVAADLRRQIEEHLSACRPCRVVADTTRRTIRIVTGSRSFELPASLSAKVMARVRATGGRPAGVQPGGAPAPRTRRATSKPGYSPRRSRSRRSRSPR